jgi:hypothetical protein
MTKEVRLGATRYLLLSGPERDRYPRVMRFLDLGEAMRLLRLLGVEAGNLLTLRLWADEVGIHARRTEEPLDYLAAGLLRGELQIAQVAVTSHGASGGGEPPEPKPKPPGPKPKPKPKPKPVTHLVVTVKNADGKPVEGVKVTAGALGTKDTDKNGVADYGEVTAGTYDITAEKPGHSKKKNDPVGKDEKKAVAVPEGKKTEVDLVQHPSCANVAFFEGSTSRPKYYGFDHKTNIKAAANGEYWLPTPAKGSLTMPGNKFTRDEARWVSVAVGKTAEVEINYAFTGPECIPCIGNSTFTVVPANIAEVETAHITAKKAVFRIKGKATGEASLKVVCDGNDLGWFHIWCTTEATLKLDVGCIITNRAPAAAYNLAALQTHFNDIYRQAAIEIAMLDLGTIDLTADAALATVENSGYNGAGPFLEKAGNPQPYASKGAVLNALHAKASASLNARATGVKPRADAYRLYWYVPTAGCSILGTVLNIGSKTSFGFAADSATARNSCAHEFGHSLNLRHPSDGSSAAHFAAHNRSTLNTAVGAFAATNTEPSSLAAGAAGNVMANDPTNLMGYWGDRPNRKPLRYHQWKIASRS